MPSVSEDFMIDRCYFALLQAYRYRDRLKQVNHERIHALSDLPVSTLTALKVLILDFDGVMGSHGEAAATSAVVTWCEKVHATLPNLKFYLLTNNPFPERTQFLQSHLPFIDWLPVHRKKPYPDGITAILEAEKIPARDALLVDDRLLTGALAAAIAGIQCLLIDKPVTNFWKRPIKEGFFGCLRFLERSVWGRMG